MLLLLLSVVLQRLVMVMLLQIVQLRQMVHRCVGIGVVHLDAQRDGIDVGDVVVLLLVMLLLVMLLMRIVAGIVVHHIDNGQMLLLVMLMMDMLMILLVIAELLHLLRMLLLRMLLMRWLHHGSLLVMLMVQSAFVHHLLFGHGIEEVGVEQKRLGRKQVLVIVDVVDVMVMMMVLVMIWRRCCGDSLSADDLHLNRTPRTVENLAGRTAQIFVGRCVQSVEVIGRRCRCRRWRRCYCLERFGRCWRWR